ncbi:MAG: V-type ATPase 116kDa subunit family protein [Gammaproteobacteria bacterium]
MSLRPVPARWFELLTARDDLAAALEALARTDSVELESHSDTTTQLVLPDLQGRLEEYNQLAHRYQRYWPQTALRPSTTPGGRPQAILDRALEQLHTWREEADPAIARLEELRAEQSDLELLQEMLGSFPLAGLDLGLLGGSGPAIAVRLFVLPPNARLTHMPPAVIHVWAFSDEHAFLLLVGPPAEVESLDQELAVLKARRIMTPGWLNGDAAECRRLVETHRRDNAREAERLETTLETLQSRHQIAHALGDIARLEWFLTHVTGLPVSENFAWVTGWTSDLDGRGLNAALQASNVRGLLRFPPAPRDKTPPMVMHNPWWAQPFEIFARLLGTPSQTEVDPSRLLALIVPLLFGYMFGDLGQGAVLVVVGIVLRRRYPFLRLLIANGLSAMVFGVLFGSVFAREDIIPALWVHPMSDPLLVLGVPLVVGMGLLLLGLLLNGIQAYWRRAGRHWLLTEAPLLVLYLALLALFITPDSLAVVLLALAWYLTGSLWYQRHHGLRVLGPALGLLLEHMMQLFINTLSFSRVGAFALAHAGLSLAVLGLAEGTHPIVTGIIMVAGNIVIIVLEGLVVSIQTTRLVLFEFFIRFLRGEGRIFHPLPAPAARPPVEPPASERHSQHPGSNPEQTRRST